MHELSIAQSIYDIVCQHVAAPERPQVRTIRVLVGTASGVVADSLEFSFQAVIAETPLAAARMEIESVPFRLQCGYCGATSENDDGLRVCGSCGSASTTILSGTELRVKDIELADGQEEKR
jgi:hydrogenase nickel incorporation protein HypA/HybF